MPASDPARLVRLIHRAIVVRWVALVLMVVPVVIVVYARSAAPDVMPPNLVFMSEIATGGLLALITMSLALDACWGGKLRGD